MTTSTTKTSLLLDSQQTKTNKSKLLKRRKIQMKAPPVIDSLSTYVGATFRLIEY